MCHRRPDGSEKDCRKLIDDAQVAQLMKDYDLHICSDLDGDNESRWVVFAIGDPGDPSVGIRPLYITPWFRDMTEIPKWLHNADRIRRLNEALEQAYDGNGWHLFELFALEDLP